MFCMCGDTRCPFCGPAQGNNRCFVCGNWDDEGGCDNPAKCLDKLKAEDEIFAKNLDAEITNYEEN